MGGRQALEALHCAASAAYLEGACRVPGRPPLLALLRAVRRAVAAALLPLEDVWRTIVAASLSRPVGARPTASA